MCDYSLESVQSRPAKVGDRLTTRVQIPYSWVFRAGKQRCCSLLTARHRVVLRRRG